MYVLFACDDFSRDSMFSDHLRSGPTHTHWRLGAVLSRPLLAHQIRHHRHSAALEAVQAYTATSRQHCLVHSTLNSLPAYAQVTSSAGGGARCPMSMM